MFPFLLLSIWLPSQLICLLHHFKYVTSSTHTGLQSISQEIIVDTAFMYLVKF